MPADFPPSTYMNRAQFATSLNITRGALDGLEKLGALVPTVARTSGDTRPVAYSTGDLALARVLLAARAVGLSGAELTTIGNSLRSRLRTLPPGWSGFAMTGDGFAELQPADNLPAWVEHWGQSLPPVLILPVRIPNPQTTATTSGGPITDTRGP